jgi:hypothetical protein
MFHAAHPCCTTSRARPTIRPPSVGAPPEPAVDQHDDRERPGARREEQVGAVGPGRAVGDREPSLGHPAILAARRHPAGTADRRRPRDEARPGVAWPAMPCRSAAAAATSFAPAACRS